MLSCHLIGLTLSQSLRSLPRTSSAVSGVLVDVYHQDLWRYISTHVCIAAAWSIGDKFHGPSFMWCLMPLENLFGSNTTRLPCLTAPLSKHTLSGLRTRLEMHAFQCQHNILAPVDDLAIALCLQTEYWRAASTAEPIQVSYGTDVEGSAFCQPHTGDPMGSSRWNLQAWLATHLNADVNSPSLSLAGKSAWSDIALWAPLKTKHSRHWQCCMRGQKTSRRLSSALPASAKHRCDEACFASKSSGVSIVSSLGIMAI